MGRETSPGIFTHCLSPRVHVAEAPERRWDARGCIVEKSPYTKPVSSVRLDHEQAVERDRIWEGRQVRRT